MCTVGTNLESAIVARALEYRIGGRRLGGRRGRGSERKGCWWKGMSSASGRGGRGTLILRNEAHLHLNKVRWSRVASIKGWGGTARRGGRLITLTIQRARRLSRCERSSTVVRRWQCCRKNPRALSTKPHWRNKITRKLDGKTTAKSKRKTITTTLSTWRVVQPAYARKPVEKNTILI